MHSYIGDTHGFATLSHMPRAKRKVAKRNRSSRRHFRHGHRAAVMRAITAAKLYLKKTIPHLGIAAEACGSNVTYVTAAVILLRSENATLLKQVGVGQVRCWQPPRR
jgi:hypothetical protein